MATIHAEQHDRITIRRLAAERLRAQGHVLGGRNSAPIERITQLIREQTGWEEDDPYSLMLRWINQPLAEAAPSREVRLLQTKPITLSPQMRMAQERCNSQPPMRSLASNIIEWREVGANRR